MNSLRTSAGAPPIALINKVARDLLPLFMRIKRRLSLISKSNQFPLSGIILARYDIRPPETVEVSSSNKTPGERCN
ncbi:hypothetical protein ES703_100323 [subsurface metagenome]